MLLGSMKESDLLGPESHQVHERHIGQSHHQKSNTRHWLALKKEGGWGGVTHRQLATSKRVATLSTSAQSSVNHQ